MKNKESVKSGQGSQSAAAVLVREQSPEIARHLVGTVLGILVFAIALVAADATHLRWPGHIVVLWFPALMAGRALSGYRGSGLIIGASGGILANLYHPSVDADIFGFVLAALAVEGIMLLLRQNPNALAGIFMGMAAALGKMLPKLAVILAGGSTPHHNRMTLSFMLGSYILFGAAAGVIYVGGLYFKRKVGPRVLPSQPKDNSGFILIEMLIVIAIIGILTTLNV